MSEIDDYLKEIARQFATGAATEHSYRLALQQLLSSAIPRATVVNEPSRIECGAPDLLVRENGAARRPIGYVEAKDVGDDDLDGNGVHREQFDRYKAELSNIVFTDYLDFHFYADGEFVAKCRVGEVAGNRIVPAAPGELERFAGLLRHFAEVAPKRITSPSRLAHLMAGKARLLARAVAATLRVDDASSSLAQQFAAFRQWLVHDLDADSFADVYAQTIVYGMFAARLHDMTPEDFSRAEAASLVPRSNPLLRRLFRDLDEYIDDSIVWIIDDLVSLFAASDVAEIMRNYGESNRDPLLHFYEDFLSAYNPALRKQRGVWYTPSPVVGYIVRSVDAILRRDFALSGGLADPSKTRVKVVNDNRVKKGDAKFVEREMHRVQILDPALGTGTFLAEVVRLVRSKFAGQEGLWPGYVRDHLVPRLNGFEILMASYAMAHLKLDLLLPEATERLRIFLTNSLEEFSEATGTLWAMELSNESREADFIKRDCPVMVVMGNPPYSVSSSNKGEWIQRLVADYKKGLGEKKINLDDDYIKFIRLGQHYIDRNGEGILAYISNNSFLDGITHRQMRKSLMESFDEIYILDLHGNARKKETAPDGGKDENVFDIMQGVSINIFVKRGKNFNAETQRRGELLSLRGDSESRSPGEFSEETPRLQNSKTPRSGSNKPLARVFHAEVFGLREAKYAFLDAHDLTSVDYKELHPQAPYYFFVPKDFALQEEYEKGFSVADLMPTHNLGVKTDRDSLFIDNDTSALSERMRVLLSGDMPQNFIGEFNVKDSSSYKITDCIRGKAFDACKINAVTYRTFDKRWLYYDPEILSRPSFAIMQHMLRENLALCLIRNSRGHDAILPFVADTIVGKDAISSLDNCRVFPLYLYSDNLGKVEKTPNLNPEIVGKIEATVAGGLASSSAARAFLDGKPVATLTGHEFEGLKGIRAIRDAVDGSFARVNHVAKHPSIGEVRLTRSGINDSLRHGFGRMKLAAFAAIPEIIAYGMVVQHSSDWKNRGYESFVVAAPLSIGGEPCCAFVIINATANDGYRFYLHEVGRLSEMKTAGGLRSGSSEETSALSSTPGSTRIVSNACVNVNGDGNIKKVARDIFASKPVKGNPAPEDVFHYVYAVLHTPSYRERYKEFLKVDFPRIPYPKSGEEFRRLASIGERLVAVHLLKDPKVRDMFSPVATFPVAGSNRVEVLAAKKAEDAKKTFRIHINSSQYFDNVPVEAWEFFVGGYQPAQKWLKDRKGRVLSSDDVLHYKSMIAALVETRRLMGELESRE